MHISRILLVFVKEAICFIGLLWQLFILLVMSFTVWVILLVATSVLIITRFTGHIKFWKKKSIGIEFAKHFRSHLGPIEGLAVSPAFWNFLLRMLL